MIATAGSIAHATHSVEIASVPPNVKAVRISRGFVALVSPEDFPAISLYKWNSLQARNTVYAVRWEYVGGERKCVYMHRQIMGEPDALVDHRDRDGLHNWKGNLREATNTQNLANVGPRAGREFKGVFAYGSNGRYRAMIAVAGKIIHLGCCDTREEAARLYDDAAFHHFGSFAYLNFPNCEDPRLAPLSAEVSA
jgi:hypothetical protein